MDYAGLKRVESFDHVLAWIVSRDKDTQAYLLGQRFLPIAPMLCRPESQKFVVSGYYGAIVFWLDLSEVKSNLSLESITREKFEAAIK